MVLLTLRTALQDAALLQQGIERPWQVVAFSVADLHCFAGLGCRAELAGSVGLISHAGSVATGACCEARPACVNSTDSSACALPGGASGPTLACTARCPGAAAPQVPTPPAHRRAHWRDSSAAAAGVPGGDGGTGGRAAGKGRPPGKRRACRAGSAGLAAHAKLHAVMLPPVLGGAQLHCAPAPGPICPAPVQLHLLARLSRQRAGSRWTQGRSGWSQVPTSITSSRSVLGWGCWRCSRKGCGRRLVSHVRRSGALRRPASRALFLQPIRPHPQPAFDLRRRRLGSCACATPAAGTTTSAR